MVAGSFRRTIALEPAEGGPITLTSRGQGVVTPTDVLVARMRLDGTFEWALSAGCTGFDGAFGLAASGERLAVTGYVSGEADLGDGCGLRVVPFPGERDPVEDRMLGTWDAFVFVYDAETGDCVDGRVFGREASDDFGFDVAGRGRGVAVRGDEVLWTFRGGAELAGPGAPLPLPAEAGLVELTPSGVAAWPLPRGALDVASAVPVPGGWVTAVTLSETRGTTLVRLEPDGPRLHEGSLLTHLPLRLAAEGSTVWAAGSGAGGRPGTLGDPPVTIDAGGQGGLVLLRIE